MKNYLTQSLCALIVFLSLSCSREEPMEQQDPTALEDVDGQLEPMSVAAINEIIEKQLELTGDFDWAKTSDEVLWSALQHAQGILTIGYGSNKEDFANKNSDSHIAAKKSILTLVGALEAEGGTNTDKNADILLYEDEYLTVIDVRATRLETITSLRGDSQIRYLEPSGYPFHSTTSPTKALLSSSGCGFEGQSVAAVDYTTISPNAKMPWNFPLHNIDDAWAYSTGNGITIGVVDTGLSPQQSLLGSNFNSGYSASGRTVEKYGVYVDSSWPWSSRTDGPNDLCGHGTSMSAAAVAPRNNLGLPVGVAYTSNLVTYRASADVLLNGYHEQRGVARAITELGARTDVKIISMSMGYTFSVGRIKDAIKYAYDRGKLIFCAGGTSTSFTNFVGVIFPATMAETVAVTGVEERNGYKECDACHKGSKIDFTIIMERATNKHVPVLGYYNGGEDYVGGSSVATASAAGIAALVWSRNPGWSRTSVLNKLKASSDLYPAKSSDYGWGNIDALKAVQ